MVEKVKKKRFQLRDTLHDFTFWTSVVHLVSGMVATIVSYSLNFDDTVSLRRNFVKWPQDGASGPFMHDYERGIDVMLRWPVILFFTLSCLFQVAISAPNFAFTKNHVWDVYYEGCIRYGVHVLRWLEYSFSSSALLIIVAAMNGIDDFHFMVLIFSSNWTLMIIGLVQEVYSKAYRQAYMNSVSTKSDSTYITYVLPHLAGWVLHIALWGIFMDKFVLSVKATHTPGWVYAFFGFIFLMYTSFGIVQFVQMTMTYFEIKKDEELLPSKPKVQKDVALFYKKFDSIVAKHSVRSEFAYVSLSLLCKTLTAWILFGGINASSSAHTFSS